MVQKPDKQTFSEGLSKDLIYSSSSSPRDRFLLTDTAPNMMVAEMYKMAGLSVQGVRNLYMTRPVSLQRFLRERKLVRGQFTGE